LVQLAHQFSPEKFKWLSNGVDRPHKNVMLNQPANEPGTTFRTPVCAGFAGVYFALKTL
jgi:hypothetical protein